MATQGATYTAQVLPPGQAGTVQTLDLMAKYVRDSQVDVGLIDFANTVLQAFNVPPRNDKAKIDAIFAYVKAAVTFRKDPYDAELVRDARRTLQAGCGDCDDIAVLLASLLACVGECPRFAIMKMSKNSPDWEHVYVEVQLGNKWLPLDTTRDPKQGKTYPGWESYYGQKAVYTIFQDGIPSTVGYANWPKFAHSMTMGRLGDDFSGDYSDGGSYDDSGYDPSMDFSDVNWDDVSSDPGFFDPGTDPNAAITPEEDELFSFLQDNFGGTPLYDPSLADLGVYQSSDGSTVFVNPDGTLSFQNSAGQYIGQLVNSAGTPVTPATVSQATAVKPQSSGGGSGASIPLSSAGGQPKPATSATSSTQSANSLIDTIAKAISSIGKATGLVNPYQGLTAQQAAALKISQSGVSASISPTTMLLIGGLALLFLSKK